MYCFVPYILLLAFGGLLFFEGRWRESGSKGKGKCACVCVRVCVYVRVSVCVVRGGGLGELEGGETVVWMGEESIS